MISSMTKMVFFVLAIYAAYQNRYKILNYLLGISSIRRYAVQFGMDIPFVRDRLMQSVFRGQ
ncbi:sodium:proton antiporter [Bacillus sp. FJAT-45066]|uniref:sodium:proton antiporter n=1 Tax=Bacillus sp. FJAT-45066 TaxID=2011010 RepID=UPI000BB9650F|nr:sodium:proton antiporter [Bacillus sp. FJAT-45066]